MEIRPRRIPSHRRGQSLHCALRFLRDSSDAPEALKTMLRVHARVDDVVENVDGGGPKVRRDE